tara:strand:- start:304 stop:738 length:435 start_codon:yes stop_codon:yes gene_type:complete
MIAEIAAANAAFALIKTALSNGKELYDVAEATTSYFDNKSAIAKKAKRGGKKEELECFMQLEKIKDEEVWLKEYMIYAGRADMWPDWLRYQSDCKRKRDTDEKLRLKKKADLLTLIKEILLWGLFGIVVVPLTIFILLKVLKVL